MRLIRFFTDQPLALDERIVLSDQSAQHAARVLRLRNGQEVTLFNGDGADYLGQLVTVERHRVVAQIHDRRVLNTESTLPLTLAQGVARGEKMDWVVQKATELGVARLVPILTERSEVRLDAARSEKRVQHWHAVAASACEQCGRARLPQIDPVRSLEEWLELPLTDHPLRLALLPEAEIEPRKLTMPTSGAVLVVGPERGFGSRDTELLHSHGFGGLRLGPRILRTETAGVAALAALQALYGDF